MNTLLKVITLMAGTTLGTTDFALAAEPPVGEQLSQGVSRFFASPQAREDALPSYAIAKEPGPGQPLAAAAVTPEFSVANGKQRATIRITPGTSLYGTGEVTGPLLRNGRVITCWNTDAYGYDDSAPSLYKSHPWVLAVRPDGTAFGILADTTYRCEVDCAATSEDAITFTADGPAFPVVIIEGATPIEVVQSLTKLTGLMPLPPKWALGYHQCRYSYYPEARVREIADGFRKRKIPCDTIWFDIDYYESFRSFTFDKGYFPNPEKLNADLLRKGFHNVWMINPGIKSREEPSPNEPPAEERVKEPKALQDEREAEKNRFRELRDSGGRLDVYVKDKDGKTYEGEVWPGWCFFPDYTAKKTRDWWQIWYGEFMARGVTGVWNDMNEPAVFNVKSKTMPEDNIHAGDPDMIKPNGKPQGDQAKGNHARYHNVYGLMMVKGSRDGIQKALPDKRPFVLSRATYIGGQRYHAGWSGDNTANWFHLESSVPMTLNMNLSGFSFYGPDIGGFASDGDAQLFERWIGFGALMPFSRGHTGKGTIDKEPWAFGPEVEETARLALQRRYRLMPYIYSTFRAASVDGSPVLRPTFFADPTDRALRSEDDAYLFGGDLLVVPQMVPDRSRVPALPKGNWHALNFKIPTDAGNTSTGFDDANDDLPKLYVRPGAIIPTGPVIEWTGQKPLNPLTLIINLDDKNEAHGSLYEDEGDNYRYVHGFYLLTNYKAKREGNRVTVSIESSEGQMPRPTRELNVRLLLKGKEVEFTGKDGGTISYELE
ncbi:MAG: glycoside hydrolase family 31 protein [Phycisphaerales bacterium]